MGRWRAGCEAHSTNQRMELSAVLDAVRTLTGPVEVVSDSTYVVNCFRDRWFEGWMRRGWVNSKKEPVANRDLWEPLVDAYLADRRRLCFRWVKGHSGDAMNDVVDRLAVAAALTQQAAEGDSPPTGLGPADAVAAAPPRPARGATADRARTTAGADDALPAGYRVVVAGLRPPGIGGYDPNPVTDVVRRRLAEILTAQHQVHPDLVVLSGLGLGAEQIGVEAAVEAGVPYVAVLPYPDPDKVWPRASRERYEVLVGGARQRVVLSPEVPGNRSRAGAALARRDAWLARHAHSALVVWDGKDELVGRLVRSLQDHLGEEEVWIVEPPPP
jgi:ribonuclease HI